MLCRSRWVIMRGSSRGVWSVVHVEQASLLPNRCAGAMYVGAQPVLVRDFGSPDPVRTLVLAADSSHRTKVLRSSCQSCRRECFRSGWVIRDRALLRRTLLWMALLRSAFVGRAGSSPMKRALVGSAGGSPTGSSPTANSFGEGRPREGRPREGRPSGAMNVRCRAVFGSRTSSSNSGSLSVQSRLGPGPARTAKPHCLAALDRR